jgi:hypothetical protein
MLASPGELEVRRAERAIRSNWDGIAVPEATIADPHT